MAQETETPLKNAKPAIGRGDRTILSIAAKGFIFGALGILLYVAHAAFVPVALALLLSLILSGPVEALHKHRIPRSVSALVILVLALGCIGGAIALVWSPAQQWFAKAPQTMLAVKQKIAPLAKLASHVDELRNNATTMGGPSHANPAAAVPATESAPALLFDATAPAIAGLMTFIIVTLFLLAGGPPMLARMTAAFVDSLQTSYVLNIIEKVRGEVGQFYLTTTLINLGLGTATGLAMWAWGMPTPYLWGAMAAVLNYIPYAGSATTLIVLTLVAVVTFDTGAHVLGVAASYIAFATLEGQVAQPLLVGRRMEVNPLLIFLGLWFGGLFWGIAGIILATPVLVALKVIAENARTGHPMMEFLGPNDQTPERDATLKRFARRF